MRRIGIVMMLLAFVVCAEGCRRNATKREPIPVIKESDFIFTRSTDSTLRKLTPPPKESGGEIDPKIAEALQKAKEQKEKEEKQKNFERVGEEYVKFVKKAKVTDLTIDKFRIQIRRAQLYDIYFEEINNGNIKPLFLCLLSQPGHILVYRTTAEDGGHLCYEVAAFNKGNVPAVLTTLNEKVLPERIKKQELEAMLYYVWDFSKSHYVTKPADSRQAARMDSFLGGRIPWASLNAIKNDPQGLGQYIKKTPERRDLGKFRRYLLENASPDFLKALDENKMRISLAADLATQDHLVVCQSEAPSKERGHMSITAAGNVNEYAPNVINQWFTQPGQEK